MKKIILMLLVLMFLIFHYIGHFTSLIHQQSSSFALLLIFLIHSEYLHVTTQSKISGTKYKALIGGKVELPCNVSTSISNGAISAIFWYKGDIKGSPIYTVDARVTTHLWNADVFTSDYLKDRVTFNLSVQYAFLIISPVYEDDNGEYRCRVDFRWSRTINTVVYLEVIVPISSVTILDHNGNEILDIGGPYNEDTSINITCKATGGFPEPEVSWWRDSNKLESTKYFVQDKIVHNVVSLPQIGPNDLLAQLTCKATNTNLTKPLSKSIKLDINLKPRKMYLSKIESFVAGEKSKLSCRASGSRPAAEISWFLDGIQLNESQSTVVSDGLLWIKISYLSINPRINDNGKHLSCSVKNPKLKSTLEEGFPMNILYKPIVSLALGSQNENIREGSLLLFECNAQANPEPEQFGWLINGKTMDSKNINGILVTPNTFLIENVTRQHKGDYSCFAANSLGATTSEPLFLDVQHKPFCKWNEARYLGTSLYKRVELECEVVSHPGHIEFQWIFEKIDGTAINLTSTFSQGISSKASFIPSSGNDFGSVYCRAGNTVGWQDDPCVFYIYPQGPPEAPSNCSTHTSNETKQIIRCEAGFNGGSAQSFHLNVYNLVTGDLIQNLSSNIPMFELNSDFSRGSFNLIVYSTNMMGESSKVDLTIAPEPIRAWPDFFGEEATSESLFKISVSFVCTLTTLLATIFMVLRFCFYRDKDNCPSQVKTRSPELNDEQFKSAYDPVVDDFNSESIPNNDIHFKDGFTIHENRLNIAESMINLTENGSISPGTYKTETEKHCRLNDEPFETILLQNIGPTCIVNSIPCTINYEATNVNPYLL